MSKNSNTKVYHHLKNKWFEKHKALQEKLVTSHREVLSSLIPKQQIIGGLMLASVPFMSLTPSALQPQLIASAQQENVVTRDQVISELKQALPQDVRPLTPEEEANVAQILSKDYHVKVAPELQGIRLNRSFGLIGKEQHLRRYPGDTTDQHFDNAEQANLYSAEGTAPGLGAWGYFVSPGAELTKQDVLRERYYIAVPTFLSPGWNENVGRYGLFYKYRKMLVVNPENGKGIIADIGDAGPAEWTGKHLGGSPEVMGYLQRVDGAQRGPVLYFFLDDPNDTIPLGPIEI